MARLQVTLPKLGLVSLIALFVGGCAGLSGLSAPVSMLVFSLVLVVGGVVACTPSDTDQRDDAWSIEKDAEQPDDVRDAADGIDQAEGTWQTCCQNGEISSCYCPPGAACNYGRFTRCGGNTCTTGFGDAGCPPSDAGDTGDVSDPDDTPDTTDADETVDTAEGTWQACCENGEISSCYCPPNVACNYGRFKRCGGDKCVVQWGNPEATCPVDAGDVAGD